MAEHNEHQYYSKLLGFSFGTGIVGERLRNDCNLGSNQWGCNCRGTGHEITAQIRDQTESYNQNKMFGNKYQKFWENFDIYWL